MRPSTFLLSLGLGLMLFIGFQAVAESATQAIQLAQAAPSGDQTQLEKEGVSGTAILVVLVAIIVLIAMAMFGGDEFEPAPVGTTHFEVPDDDEPFVKGDFWFEGVYYCSAEKYQSEKGHLYTKRMYNSNFDTWGLGQGRDEERDALVLEEAADTGAGEGEAMTADDTQVANLADDNPEPTEEA